MSIERAPRRLDYETGVRMTSAQNRHRAQNQHYLLRTYNLLNEVYEIYR